MAETNNERMSEETDNQRLDRTTREMAAKLPAVKSKGQNKPEVYGHRISIEWFREFSFLQRIAILFGANLVVTIGIATRHNPGAFHPFIIGEITKHRTATDKVKATVADMLVDRDKAECPVVHEKEANEKR